MSDGIDPVFQRAMQINSDYQAQADSHAPNHADAEKKFDQDITSLKGLSVEDRLQTMDTLNDIVKRMGGDPAEQKLVLDKLGFPNATINYDGSLTADPKLQITENTPVADVVSKLQQSDYKLTSSERDAIDHMLNTYTQDPDGGSQHWISDHALSSEDKQKLMDAINARTKILGGLQFDESMALSSIEDNYIAAQQHSHLR